MCDIRNLCTAKFGAQNTPDKYYFVEKFIVNANGKIDTRQMMKNDTHQNIFDVKNISIKENVEYWIQTIIESMTGIYFNIFALESKLKLSSLGITSIDMIIIYDIINKKCPIIFSDFSNCVRVSDVIDLILHNVVSRNVASPNVVSEICNSLVVNTILGINFVDDIEMSQQGLTSIDFFRLQSFLKKKYNYILKSSNTTPQKINTDIEKNIISDCSNDYYYLDNNSCSPFIIIFVYPISGNSVVYDIFSMFLNDHDMIFLNYPHTQNLFTNIEELAEHHCSEILSRIKNKIPILVGWSFGGILATAIADYYNKYFGTINNIIVFDSYFNFDINDKNNSWSEFIKDFNTKIPHLNLDYIHATIKTLLNITSEYNLPDLRGNFLYFQCESMLTHTWCKLFPNSTHTTSVVADHHHRIFTDKNIPYILVDTEKFINRIHEPMWIDFQDIDANSLVIFDIDGTLTNDKNRLSNDPTPNKKIIDFLLSVKDVIISSAHPDFTQSISLVKKIGLEAYVEDHIETFVDGDFLINKCGRCISVKKISHKSEFWMAKITSIKYYAHSATHVTLIDDNIDVCNYNQQLTTMYPDIKFNFCHI